jgi:hypothetical protein
MVRRLAAVAVATLLARTGAAGFAQQGSKLVGTGAVGAAQQGFSVAVSADGTTAIVGGYADDSNAGAAWVFVRSGGVWTQQGNKLVGTGAVGKAAQGTSVAISADGNTAIVGGYGDGSNAGAAWVFTRSGGVWTQQGSKLVGTGAVGIAAQGTSVAISADGNTAVVGGFGDNTNAGAAWVFTRSGGVWTQQGSKLAGSGEVGQGNAGSSLAISGDGNTVLIGGPQDHASIGAAWVFTRSGGVWSQQGNKLVGTGVSGTFSEQGTGVALSGDGSTAFVGGSADNGNAGAAWVFTRSGGTWTQQGGKLVGSGGAGSQVELGLAVAISGDGNTAIAGGPLDNSSAGAAWVFARSGGVWTQQGSKLLGAGAAGPSQQGYSVAISADGSTAVVGSPHDGSSTGAVWAFASSPSFDVWVPVASHNPGKNSSQWRSDLGLLNPGSVTANVRVKFYSGGGVLANSTYVPPKTQSILTDIVGQLGGSSSGAIEIVSDQALKVTARSYNLVAPGAACYPNGTQGQDYPVVSPGDGLSAGQSAYLPGLSEDPSYRSNVGLVDTGAAAATVLVELFDGAGNKLTDYTVPLNPGDWKQETEPFLNKAGDSALQRGYARVTVQSGSGVFAFASVVDAVTNDPTTVAMQR